MTIADNAMRQGSNWADGNIGSKVSNGGGLYRGNNGDSDSVGYDGPDPDTRSTGDRPRKAYFELSNGNKVYDISGNVWEWTNGYVTTDGVPEPGDNGWTEYTEITNFRSMEDEKPLNPAWDADNGIGRIYLDQSP
jgi:formylglycine-generating enzyme required for sulfatase activity